jgi:hypothetical protein
MRHSRSDFLCLVSLRSSDSIRGPAKLAAAVAIWLVNGMGFVYPASLGCSATTRNDDPGL